MMMRKLSLLTVSLAMLGTPLAIAEDKTNDTEKKAAAHKAADQKAHDTAIEKLQGRWQIVSGTNQGRKLSSADVDGTYVTITTNTIVTYDRDQRQKFRAVFQTDSSKKPIEITMTSVTINASTDKLRATEPSAQPGALGILKFSGDQEWTLCYGLPGAERPTKFESAEGSRTMLFTLQKDQGDPVAKQ